ncbi:MAG: hypothetical protein GDA53_10075 [Rhodobacteraceae bacterium]|nr:hypothetical protein [Paracoccaceae bacterium]
MRKKDIGKISEDFIRNIDEITAFVKQFVQQPKGVIPSEKDQSWLHEAAIIRIYVEFEKFILACLVALINRDSPTFSKHKGIKFPKHISQKVCEYLICGDGYFDFKGRDGLINKIKKIVPNGHWFLKIIMDKNHKEAIERLSALRNFAAHDSGVSKKQALQATKQKRISSSDAWLKKQNRLDDICEKLKAMADEIKKAAP